MSLTPCIFGGHFCRHTILHIILLELHLLSKEVEKKMANTNKLFSSIWSTVVCHSAVNTLDLSRSKYRDMSSSVKTLQTIASFGGRKTFSPPCHQCKFGRTITGVSVTAQWRLLCLPKSSPFLLMSHYGYVLSQSCSLPGWVSETARQRING